MNRRDEIKWRHAGAKYGLADRQVYSDIDFLLVEVEKWKARADEQANLAMNLQARIEAGLDLLTEYEEGEWRRVQSADANIKAATRTLRGEL